MRDARIALAAGLALTAVAVAIILSHSPEVLTGTNGIAPHLTRLTSVPGGGNACQTNETLAADSSAIRLSLETSAGPRVAVTVLSGKTVITHGDGVPGWLGDVVTIPIKPLDHAVHDTTVCFAFTGAHERVSFLGVRTPTRIAATSRAGTLPGRIGVEYLRPGSSSWWSLARSTSRRMGLGRAWAGTWIVLLVTTLMATGVALASWLMIRAPR
jgi:hypothetical protein